MLGIGEQGGNVSGWQMVVLVGKRLTLISVFRFENAMTAHVMTSMVAQR